MTGDRRDETAAEARDLVRRAVGDAAGLTVKGQLRQAARHLGYAVDVWRLREAWYSRAGSWSAAALNDLRRRFAAWRDRQQRRGTPAGVAEHLAAVRDGLAELQRRFGELEAEVARALGRGDATGPPDGGGAPSASVGTPPR